MKKIPFGVWVFAAVALLSLVLYQAFVVVPQNRMLTTEEKNVSCSEKINQCYQGGDRYVENSIDSACKYGVTYGINSQDDIDAADEIMQSCITKQNATILGCAKEYTFRLRLNCKIPNADIAQLEKEKDARIETCLAKLYECK